jgi:peptidylprolyl isomerase
MTGWMVMAALAAGGGTAAVGAPKADTAPAKDVRSPTEIVAAAPAGDWVTIAAEDMLVMDLAPDARGRARRVVIQLMPPPFSQGWVGNIRTLAAAHWWDGLSINRVQDNYVVQWGDAQGDDEVKAKPLPSALAALPLARYEAPREPGELSIDPNGFGDYTPSKPFLSIEIEESPYIFAGFYAGWPIGRTGSDQEMWPIHCYGMVGVGRGMPPDTGSGAELYAVIGHAPRHLDRNLAIVGRVIAGIEHLSSLPRGTGALGFYADPAERVPIVSVRLASELPPAQRPRHQYLSTESESFARYADARANRREPFFVQPAGGADICNMPVPVRPAP